MRLGFAPVILGAFLCLFLCVLTSSVFAGVLEDKILNACPEDVPPAKIGLHIVWNDPPINQTKSLAEINSMKISTPSPYGSDVRSHVYGLMQGAITFAIKSQVAAQHNRISRKACYWFHAVDVTVTLKPEIYIAREVAPKSCYFNAILGHEMQHMQIDRQLLNEYHPIIVNTLTEFAAKQGFLRNQDPAQEEASHEFLSNALDRQIDTIHDHVARTRGARQAQIDTAQEYDRVAAPCKAVEKLPF